MASTLVPAIRGLRMVTGSASHYCVSHATCPVVTVPEPSVDGPALDSSVKQAEPLTMKWCVDCHRSVPVAERARKLTDCSTCHR